MSLLLSSLLSRDPYLEIYIPQKAALADWKKVLVWMMMMIAVNLMWAGAAEKPEQSKMTFKNHQNDSKQLTKLPNQI